MSEEKTTRFHFVLSGVELEISGERGFVEAMYKQIMQDIEEARHMPAASIAEAARPAPEQPAPKRRARAVGGKQVVWIHRTSEMMHKIYMSSPDEVAAAPVLRSFDTSRIGAIYAEKDLVRHVLKDEPGQTLWAELTDAGRRKIAEANAEEA